MGLIEYNTSKREYTDVKYKNMEYRLFKNCYFEKAIGKSLNTYEKIEYNKLTILKQLIQPTIFVASKDREGVWKVIFNIGIKEIDITNPSVELDKIIDLIYKIDAKTKIEKLCKHPNGIYSLRKINNFEKNRDRYEDNIEAACTHCYLRGNEISDILIPGEFTHTIKLNEPITIVGDENSTECKHLYEKHIKVIIPKGCYVRFMLRDGMEILNIEDIGGILGTFPSQILKKKQIKFNCIEYIEHDLHSPLDRESKILKLEFGSGCKLNKIPANTLKHLRSLEELIINSYMTVTSDELIGLENLKSIKEYKNSIMIGTKIPIYKKGKFSELNITKRIITIRENS